MFLYVIVVTSEQYQFPSSARSAVPRQSCAAVLPKTTRAIRNQTLKIKKIMFIVRGTRTTAEWRDHAMWEVRKTGVKTWIDLLLLRLNKYRERRPGTAFVASNMEGAGGR